jgi:hypothetical protein
MGQFCELCPLVHKRTYWKGRCGEYLKVHIGLSKHQICMRCLKIKLKGRSYPQKKKNERKICCLIIHQMYARNLKRKFSLCWDIAKRDCEHWILDQIGNSLWRLLFVLHCLPRPTNINESSHALLPKLKSFGEDHDFRLQCLHLCRPRAMCWTWVTDGPVY